MYSDNLQDEKLDLRFYDDLHPTKMQDKQDLNIIKMLIKYLDSSCVIVSYSSESNLAYLDYESMLGPFDMWFEAFGVLDVDDDDFSAADHYAAQEIATTLVYALTHELPKYLENGLNH